MIAQVRAQVVDEADRLLTQSFQDWLKQILAAIQSPPSASPQIHERAPTTTVGGDDDQWLIPHHDALSPAYLIGTAHNGHTVFTSDYDEPVHSSCQKLLFSATLTSNPSQIAELNLRDAKWFVVKGKSEEDVEAAPHLDEAFELPPGLRVRRGNVCLRPVTLTFLIRNT